MGIKAILDAAKVAGARNCGKIKLWGMRNGPTIGVVVGLASLGFTVYSACKATLRVDEVLSRHNEELSRVKETYSREDELPQLGLTEKDRRHDIFVVYSRTIIGLTRLYGPAIIAGGIGVTSIICAHNAQSRRIQSVAAAYSALQSVFERYRRVVRARYGEEADYYAINGVVEDTDKTVKIKDDDGNEVERQVHKFDPGIFDGYSAIFDSTCGEFEKFDAEYNLAYLKAKENEANIYLNMRGHMFLNEVYDLVFGPGESYVDPVTGERHERRKIAGQYVGWKKDGDGDGHIDFRIKVMYDDPCYDDSKPFEAPPILIDPNVDGVIMDCLVPPKKQDRTDFAIDNWKNRAEIE